MTTRFTPSKSVAEPSLSPEATVTMSISSMHYPLRTQHFVCSRTYGAALAAETTCISSTALSNSACTLAISVSQQIASRTPAPVDARCGAFAVAVAFSPGLRRATRCPPLSAREA